MSNVKIKGNASGTGNITIEAPNTNTDRTLTLPDEAGTISMVGPSFSATKSASTQSLTAGINTKVTFDNEEWDTDACYTGSTFTPNKAGIYNIIGSVYVSNSAEEFIIKIYKNGVFHKAVYDMKVTSYWWCSGSALVEANGTTDYFEIYVYLGGSVGETIQNDGTGTYFQANFVRST